MEDLYEKLLDYNNLYETYLNCKKEISWKESVQRYGSNLFQNLLILHRALESQTYKQRPFYEFDICERGKTRHIKSMHISDRILQRALCDYVLNPTLSRFLIYDNGASVKGKGLEFSRDRVKLHLQKYYRKYGNRGYVLLIDFSKYFDNIPHDILIQKLSEKIHDSRVMKLVSYLINSFGGDKGVGIGSQLSQTVGVFYPTELDQFCKTVKGCKYYGRYMDDTYIIHSDKEYLKTLFVEYSKIATSLGIIINTKKTQIVNLKNGFKFLQMRYKLSDTGKIFVIPVRKSVVRERRKLKKLANHLKAGTISYEQIQEQYKSWRGNIIRYNSYKSVRNTDFIYKNLFGGKYEENPQRSKTRSDIKRDRTCKNRRTDKKSYR